MNRDLLGRPIRTVRVVPPIVSADDRDGKTLSLEDQTLQRANAPRRYTLTIKGLELRAATHETDYGRAFLRGTADRLRKQLNRK